MRVFKSTYKARDGSKKETKRWYVEIRDHLRIVRRFPVFADKAQSLRFGEKLEKLVVAKQNGEPPNRELSAWLEQIPAKLIDRFVKIGLLDIQRAAAGKSLEGHLDDFEECLNAKGNSVGYVKQLVSRARRVVRGCHFRVWADIQPSKVQRHLANLRDGEDGISAQTSNFYLQALRQFCRWMVQDQRASESPLEHLKGLNVRTDRRHDRRALEPDEVRRLLEATEAAPKRFGMIGYERALLYRLAIETGLRANELRSLKVSSFDLDECEVAVEAAYSKRKRRDVLPLRVEMASELEDFFRGKTPNVKAFGGHYKKLTDKTSKMLQADLAEAGISFVDDSGRYADFHSLRHTTGTWLAASGVHPKVAQSIMRHSDINLTMSRYSHTLLGAEAEAIASLPDCSPSSRERQKATGTDGKTDLALNSAFLGAAQVGSNAPQCKDAPLNDTKNRVLTTPGRTRTFDLRFRKPMLYPAELRALVFLSDCTVYNFTHPLSIHFNAKGLCN